MVNSELKNRWKKLKGKQRIRVHILLGFSIAYLIFFTVLAIAYRNFEFLYYIFVVVGLIIATTAYYKEFYLSLHMIAALSIFGLMHILGGFVYIGATRLYDFYLVGGVLRYDNLVHTIGSALAAIVAYNMLRPHVSKGIRHNPVFYGLLLLLIASGIGALNEIIEFFGVAFLKAKGVGDYVNNALDLVFNLIGAALATMYIFALNKQHRKEPDIVLKTRRQK